MLGPLRVSCSTNTADGYSRTYYRQDPLPVDQLPASMQWQVKQRTHNRLQITTRCYFQKIQIYYSLSLSLSILTAIFQGEPGLAGIYWSKGWRMWWWQLLTGAISRAKLQSKDHHQQTNSQSFFTGQMPLLSPNQQCQSTEGKMSHSMDLLTPSSRGDLPTLSVTTISSW